MNGEEQRMIGELKTQVSVIIQRLDTFEEGQKDQNNAINSVRNILITFLIGLVIASVGGMITLITQLPA